MPPIECHTDHSDSGVNNEEIGSVDAALFWPKEPCKPTCRGDTYFFKVSNCACQTSKCHRGTRSSVHPNSVIPSSPGLRSLGVGRQPRNKRPNATLEHLQPVPGSSRQFRQCLPPGTVDLPTWRPYKFQHDGLCQRCVLLKVVRSCPGHSVSPALLVLWCSMSHNASRKRET